MLCLCKRSSVQMKLVCSTFVSVLVMVSSLLRPMLWVLVFLLLTPCDSRDTYNVSIVILLKNSGEDSEKTAEVVSQMFHQETFPSKYDLISLRYWQENVSSLERSQVGEIEVLSSIENISSTVDGAIFVDVTSESLALSSLMENSGILTVGLFQAEGCPRTQENRAEFTRAAFPPIEHYVSSIWKIIKRHGWHTLCLILFADYEGRIFADGILSFAQQEKWKILKIAWFSDATTDDDKRTELEEVIRNESDVVVVHTRMWPIERFFEAVRALGFGERKSVWLMTDITTYRIPSSPELPEGLLKISLKKPEIRHDYKLYMDALHDAIILFGRSFELSARELCSGEDAYECLKGLGSKMVRSTAKRHMVKQSFKGRSALFERSPHNQTHPAFKVWNLKRGTVDVNKWFHVGLGTSTGLALDKYTAPNSTTISPKLEVSRHVVRVAANEYPPFVYKRDPFKGEECLGRSVPCYQYEKVSNSSVTKKTKFCCSGASLDFLAFLQRDLNFDPEIYLNPDGKYGTFDENTNKWNGIVNEMLSGRAMLSLEMGLNTRRAEVIGFAHPILPLRLSILVRKNGTVEQDTRRGYWYRPFSTYLWLTMVGTSFFFVFVIWWLDRKSPKGYYYLLKDKDEDGFTLLDSISYIGGVAFGKDIGPEKTPRSVSARLVSCFYSFLALIMINTYCANLMAFLVEEVIVLPINGIDDPKLISEPPVFKVGAIRGSNEEDFFKQHMKASFRKMYDVNLRKNSVATLREGVQKLDSGEIQGLVGDYLSLRQIAYTDTECRFSLIEDNSFQSGYGFAFSKTSPWLQDITLSVLKNQDNGTIQLIHDRWFAKQPCQSSRHRPLKSVDFQDFYMAVVSVTAFSVLTLFVDIVLVFLVVRFGKCLGPFGKFLKRFLFNVKKGEENQITLQRQDGLVVARWPKVVRAAEKQHTGGECGLTNDGFTDVSSIERKVASLRWN